MQPSPLIQAQKKQSRLIQYKQAVNSQADIERALKCFAKYGNGRDPHGFIFNHCYTNNRNTGKWEKIPPLPYLEDVITLIFEAPRGSEVFDEKARKLMVTTGIYCAVPIYAITMMRNQSTLWTGTDKRATKNLLNQYIKETIRLVDIPLLPIYETIDTLEVPALKNTFLAGSRGAAHFTGPEYTFSVLDEWTFQDDQEEIMMKIPDATRNGVRIKIMTPLAGTLAHKERFEDSEEDEQL